MTVFATVPKGCTRSVEQAEQWRLFNAWHYYAQGTASYIIQGLDDTLSGSLTVMV